MTAGQKRRHAGTRGLCGLFPKPSAASEPGALKPVQLRAPSGCRAASAQEGARGSAPHKDYKLTLAVGMRPASSAGRALVNQVVWFELHFTDRAEFTLNTLVYFYGENPNETTDARMLCGRMER